MTANKPEVVAWIKETWRSATESRPVVHDWEDNGSVVSPLVRLSEYEALQAKCKEEIYRALQYRDAHFEALMQAIEQVDALKAEYEKLRKDAELWESIHDEIHRRADKEHALADRCDFDVTIMYEDYAAIDAAMAGDTQ